MEPWLSPLYDADGMRAIDRWAIEEMGVPSLELMEAAGRAVAELVGELAPEGPLRVVCGKGNNAGDGLVAARYLREAGFEIEALLLWPAKELSGDAAANLDRFQDDGGSVQQVGGSKRPIDVLRDRLADSGAVVDAIFGTGFAGAPREPALGAIDAINGCGAPVVACDVASGVDASSGEIAGAAVEADRTVSFHAAKVGHFVAPGKWHTGELRVAPIGIPDGARGEPAAGTIDASVLELPPRRGPRSTKFSSGQVTIAGASRGLTGAVQMSSRAAIRAGAGYATVAVPADLEPTFELGQPEVMSVGCPGGDGCLAPASAKPLLRAFERAAAGVLGPGLGRDPGSVELAREVLPAIEAPLVLDADGLNAFAGELDRIAARSSPTVLTPHAGELGRLLDRPSGDVDAHRLAAAREAAVAAGAVVVLKGDDTIVTDGEQAAVNRLSAPALATAGTGDVLSGIVAALLARGLEPFVAACAAVLAGARAGRGAAARIGAAESVIATDVIDSIPTAIRPDSATIDGFSTPEWG
jgi:ADP-dependent NAD(P)H-hydrate dehydratase / NAD(P)H-hydrate epimerase